MKIITIGDIHGKTLWKEAIDYNNIDSSDTKYIFIGDYVDSFNETDQEIIDNLREIIALKRSYPDHIKLLWGNHDYQYLYLRDQTMQRKVRCSGFRESYAETIFQLFIHNKDIFNAAYQHKNYLWTHAGISDFAYRMYFQTKLPKNKLEWADELNRLFVIRDDSLWHISRARGGTSHISSIFWADISETMGNPVKGLHQIVGHTRVEKIYTEVPQIAYTDDPEPNTSITYVDCLDNTVDFYELNI